MKSSDIKPWSQLDEELEEREAAAGDVTGTPGDDLQSLRRAGHTVVSARFSAKLATLPITPYWAFPPLLAAAGWMVYGVFRAAGQGNGIPIAHALGLLALILAGGGLLAMALHARKAAL